MTALNTKQWWENQRRYTTDDLDCNLFYCHFVNNKHHLKYTRRSLPSWLRILYVRQIAATDSKGCQPLHPDGQITF
jgi:hypothetical protein